jgi:hypothetical protein
MKKFFASPLLSAAIVLSLLLAAWPASRLAGAQSQPPPGKTLLNLFCLAKRMSALEPCGCHTLQRGGVQFEATIYHQYDKLPGIRVDAGGWTVGGANLIPSEAMKTRYLMRAMGELQMDAVNFNWLDVALDPEFIRHLGATHPEATRALVSANLFRKDDPSTHAFAPYRIVRRTLADGKVVTIGLTGVTAGKVPGARPAPTSPAARADATSNANYTIKSIDTALPAVLEELRPRVDLLVVMDDGDFQENIQLARRYPTIDFLISSGYELPPGTLGYQEGTVRMLSVPNNSGKEIAFAPLTRDDQGHWDYAAPPRSIYVTIDTPEDPDLMKLVMEYRQETKTLEVQPPPNLQRRWAPAASCRNCHQPEYTDWASSPHAHAMAALINKGEEGNPDCLKCHTVGYREQNGFWSITHIMSRQMANVQCDNCHGPSYEHQMAQETLQSAQLWMPKDQLEQLRQKAAAAIPRREVPESTCLACHTPENDLTWSYAEKLPKVDHHGVKPTPTPSPGPTPIPPYVSVPTVGINRGGTPQASPTPPAQ